MVLRVGIQSAAWGGFAHLPAWRSLEGVEVVAMCTSREETARAACERLGIERPFWDAMEMCRDPDIDIVDLGTRPGWRLPWVVEALENGKHIYNSSPHAPHWEGAKAIDAAWDRSRSKTAMDAFSRYLPAHVKMRQMIADGYLGRILGGSFRFNMSLFNRPIKQFPYNWFAHKDAGVSALRNFGSHLLYMVLETLGPVEELIADETMVLEEWTFPDGDTITPENPDYANLILKFASGVRVTFQTCWSSPAQEGWTFDLFGEDGHLKASAPSFPTAEHTKLEAGEAGARDLVALQPVELDMSGDPAIAMDPISDPAPSYPMAATMRTLIDAIEGQDEGGSEGQGSPSFADALEVERVLEAARISNAERRWVKLADVS